MDFDIENTQNTLEFESVLIQISKTHAIQLIASVLFSSWSVRWEKSEAIQVTENIVSDFIRCRTKDYFKSLKEDSWFYFESVLLW